MSARIYQRPKNAMQSGKARTDEWVLEFEQSEARHADPLDADLRRPVVIRALRRPCYPARRCHRFSRMVSSSISSTVVTILAFEE